MSMTHYLNLGVSSSTPDGILMPYGIINYTHRKYETLYERVTDFILIVIIKTWWIMLIIVYLNLFGNLGCKLFLIFNF
jgi:hypothetical protein